MAVTKEDVDTANEAFTNNPTQETAAMFLSKLREAEENGELTDDEFMNGLADIEAYLWKGGTVTR